MNNPSPQRGSDPPSPMTLTALLDVLAERYGPAVAAAVVAQLRLEPGQDDRDLASAVVYRAIDMAEESMLAMAGTAFLEHFGISAVADTAGFRTAARSAGLDPGALGIEDRLRVDAAFASAWREQRWRDPCFGGREAAVALMQDVLRTLR